MFSFAFIAPARRKDAVGIAAQMAEARRVAELELQQRSLDHAQR